MEHVEAILYHKIMESDFTNMYTVKKPSSGGGQSYIQAAGYSREELDDMFQYAKRIEPTPEFWDADRKLPRMKYTIEAFAPTTGEKQDMEFAPRTGRADYRIARQNLRLRHPAWLPSSGFPTPRLDPSSEKVAYLFEKGYPGIIENLYILIVLTVSETGKHRYYAAYVNSLGFPVGWPRGIGLEAMFKGEKKKGGILRFQDAYLRWNNDRDELFTLGSAADQDIESIALPDGLEEESTDAVEYAPVLLGEFDVKDVSAVRILAMSPPAPIKRSRRSDTHSSKTRRHLPQKADYKTRQENLKKIGDLGEKLTIEAERRRLIAEGRADLAAHVEHVAKTQGDGLGYDIRSFEKGEDGEYREKYIEVKATTGGRNKPFEITANEVEVSEEKGEQYSIYRFYGLHNEASEVRFYEMRGSVSSHFSLVPTVYRAQLK